MTECYGYAHIFISASALPGLIRDSTVGVPANRQEASRFDPGLSRKRLFHGRSSPLSLDSRKDGIPPGRVTPSRLGQSLSHGLRRASSLCTREPWRVRRTRIQRSFSGPPEAALQISAGRTCPNGRTKKRRGPPAPPHISQRRFTDDPIILCFLLPVKEGSVWMSRKDPDITR